ncbi:MAG: hypothetical protein AAGA48_30910 [Myxococcota bacterium]
MTELWVGLAVLAGLIAAGGALRAYGALTRRRALAGLSDGATLLRSFTMRVMARGRHGLPGIAAGRTHRTTGDLGYDEQRLMLTSNRGVLLDLRSDGGRTLHSVRSTGPGKLVIEGEALGASGPAGQFRIELAIPQAGDVAQALQRFAKASADGPAFATRFEGDVTN